MNRVIIGIGSNIQPTENIARAKNRIVQSHPIVRESRFVETKPIADETQPNYINGAILIETTVDRGTLKGLLRDIESDLGRRRGGDRYNARTVDLDIVVWNGQIVDEDVYEREFLRAAILEVWPDLKMDR